MPVFDYEALDRAEKKIRGTIEAETQEVIIEKLRGMGYFPIRVELSNRKIKGRIRAGVEIPLPVVIPAGEQRFINFSLPLPEDYNPGTSATEWRIAARLIARDTSLVPVGLDLQGDNRTSTESL
jgi:hypothetical protein